MRAGFVETFNSLLYRRETALAEYGREIIALSDMTALTDEKARCEAEIARTKAELTAFAATVDAQDATRAARYLALAERVGSTQTRLTALEARATRRKNRKIALELFASGLKAQEQPIAQFEEMLWLTMIDRVAIRAKGTNEALAACVNFAGIAETARRCVGIAEYHYKDGRVILWAIQ